MKDLRIPEVRVLMVLAKLKNGQALSRVQMSESAGFSAGSGTINRVLHGIPKKSSSGKPFTGTVDRGLIRAKEYDVDGTKQTLYVITPKGAKAVKAALKVEKFAKIK